MRVYYLASVALFFLAGCATKSTYLPIEYRLADRPDERRIEVIYENETNTPICISADYWPNAAGKLNQMGNRVFLVINGERFSIENFNTGYCIGDSCAKRVAPGEEISASIPYKDFDLP